MFWLPGVENRERSAQTLGDGPGDDHPASRDAHHHAGADLASAKLAGQDAAGIQAPLVPHDSPTLLRSGRPQATFTSMAFGFTTSDLARCTFSTPSLKSACTFFSSASSGMVKARMNFP